MSLWSWRTMPDGLVEVNRGDGLGFVATGLEEYVGLRSVLDDVLRWLPLVSRAAREHDVPEPWILSVIYAESRGDPHVTSWTGCCHGLMQIHGKIHGFTKQELYDPELNIDFGTSLIRQSIDSGCDLPGMASQYVAGAGKGVTCPTKPGTCCSALCRPDCNQDTCVTAPGFPHGSPWAMCEHMFEQRAADGSVGHIDRIVRANNTFVRELELARKPPGPLPVVPAGVGEALAPFFLGAAGGYAGITLLRWGLQRWVA